MIAEAPREDKLAKNHRLIKTKAYANCWDDLVLELRPLIELAMQKDNENDPLAAVRLYVKEVEKQRLDVAEIITAVAYELKLKRKNDVVKNRKSGWTL